MRVTPYSPTDFEDFWQARVSGWLLADIEKSVAHHVNLGACTLAFCCIEFLGLLLRPNLGRPRDRFLAFVDLYLVPINAEYSKRGAKLYDTFRSGLVHEGIIKKGGGIFRSDDLGDKSYQHLALIDNALWLDVIVLRDDLVEAAAAFKRDLDSDIALRQAAVTKLRKMRWKLENETLQS